MTTFIFQILILIGVAVIGEAIADYSVAIGVSLVVVTAAGLILWRLMNIEKKLDQSNQEKQESQEQE